MSKTILIVDDLATQRTAVSYTLSGAGFDVLQASSGREALIQLESSTVPIQLVISDLTMPEMDGLALLQSMKQNPQLEKIPVLMLLMESQVVEKEQIRAAGAAGWIIKPFQPEQLCAVVNQLVS